VPTTQYVPPSDKISSTALSNGIQAVSYEGAGPLASVGVIIKGGASFETHQTAGVFHFLKHMALKSTNNLSSLRLTRVIESLTDSFEVRNGREETSYYAQLLPQNVPEFLSVLAEVLRPRLPEWEVRDTRPAVLAESEASKNDISTHIHDLVHQTAFRTQGMGRPRFIPAYNVERISETHLSETVQNFYVGSRIALVATGVNHAEFSEAAEKALSGIPKHGGNVVQEETKYYGGEHRELAPSGTHLVIAYGSEGRRTAGADFVLAKVLGGGAQNKATPGSGASSRLYQNVVEKHSWIASARPYGVLHANQSLIGVQGYTPVDGHAEPLAAALETELKQLADQPISEEELGRAKAQFKSTLDSYFATRKAIVSNLGSTVLAGTGTPASISQLAVVDSVSAKDVQSAAQRLLRQRPTVVVVGDATGLAPRS